MRLKLVILDSKIFILTYFDFRKQSMFEDIDPFWD